MNYHEKTNDQNQKKMKPVLYIALDFDGTIVDSDYPTIVRLKDNAKDVITRLHQEGHRILINTCRGGIEQEEAKQFLLANDVPFDTINENHPELIRKYGNDSRKLGADIYVDDKGLFCESIDWLDIERRVASFSKEDFAWKKRDLDES